MRTHLHPPHGAIPVARSLRVERATPDKQDGNREDDHRIASSRKPDDPERDRVSEHPVSEHPGRGRPRAGGVVRLLREGHFRGVADVRLRMRFHDTLLREQQAQVKEIVEKGIEQIVEHVAAPIDALVESDRLSDDQADALREHYAAFKASVLEAGTAFAASEKPQPEHVTSSLRDAFDAFQTSVQALLQPDAAEPDDPSVKEAVSPSEAQAVSPARVSAEEAAALEESDDPAAEAAPSASSFADFLNGLADVFTRALEELTEAIQNTEMLPPLHEPSRRSHAYEKFVAAYAELRGPAETTHTRRFETLA